MRTLTNEEFMELVIGCRWFSHFPSNLKTRFDQQLLEKLEPLRYELLPENKIKMIIEKVIEKMQPTIPGKSVGIITGQSIGELHTQGSLNTFHRTGLAHEEITKGVPRFMELIDTNQQQTQQYTFCKIYLNTPAGSPDDIRNLIGPSLVYFTFGDIAKSVGRGQWFINLEIMFRYRITLEYLRGIIMGEFPTSAVTISELHEATMWVNGPDDEELLPVVIGGIRGISSYHIQLDAAAVHVITIGTNLPEILQLPYVDTTRTISSDVWEMYKIYGIDVCRQWLYDEFKSLMPKLHTCHLSLLADRMTFSGELKSINRYTRKKERNSVLSKITFEETMTGLTAAAVSCEIDPIIGCSARIICGRVPQVGSGFIELIPENK